VLRTQISSGLGFSLTGSPMWNCDLGGFGAWEYRNVSGDTSPTENRAWRELYVRWIQYGVFLPMMRSHGTAIHREFYEYGQAGEPVYDALVNAVKTRYALLPFIYSTAWQVHKNGKSFMMPVDGRTDAYLFGDSIFVQPITHALYTDEKSFIAPGDTDFSSVKPYELTLPDGIWYDYQTGKRYEGGKSYVLSVTIATVPAFVRAGTILPIGPDVQYAAEKPWDDLEVRVYTGADGRFVLYEDAGDGFGYERGEYIETVFTWDDAAGKLSIDDPKGRKWRIREQF
jgi:alpha-D-xyloside xylohydrolase